MDVGVTDDSLNGAPYDQSPSSTEDEEEEEEEEDGSFKFLWLVWILKYFVLLESTSRKVVKSRKLRERPVSFGKMEDVKSVWENGVAKTKEELREERKQEIQQIRSRLFMGKQVKMKEAYEQAVRESEATGTRKSIETFSSDKAKSIKECFEKGEPLNDDEDEDGKDAKKNGHEDSEVFEAGACFNDDWCVCWFSFSDFAGISKKSRSLFLELDKTAQNQVQPNGPKANNTTRTPATPTKHREVSFRDVLPNR